MNRHELLSHRVTSCEQTRWNGRADPAYYSARSRRIIDLIGDQKVSKVDSAKVTAALLKEGLKVSTINRYLSVLAALGVPVSYTKEVGRRDRILSDDELARLDQRVRNDSDEHCKALYAFLRDSGCRGLAEWERFDWSRCDFENAIFELDSRKGGIRYRQVPMTDVSKQALAWMYHSNSRVSESQWRKFWQRVRLSKSNIPYDLRHKFCTRMLSKGVPPPTVMLIMGHNNLEQTLAYFHQSSEALRDVAAKLNL